MNNIEKFLKDISYNSKYSFLEEGRDESEIGSIANKRGIKLPCHDLAIFKCTYGFVDRQNLNGCTLPKGEVEKTLNTLVGKAVDFDHMRQRVVGHWIDAKIENDQIVAYGVFFKGNFQEDYAIIKSMMEKDVLAISFEAYGNKKITGERSYELTDIEFSGGALLIKTNPAFPGSEVMEMAKERVLEFAKIMTEPVKYVYDDVKKKDIETSVKKDGNTGDKDMKNKEKATLTDLENKKDLQFTVKCNSCGYVFKSEVRGESTQCTKCSGFTTTQGVPADGVPKSVNIGEEDKKMKEKIEALELEVSGLKEEATKKDVELQAKVTELEAATATIGELKLESEEAKVRIEEIETAKAIEIEKAKSDAIKLTERSSELGEEFSKDVDLLDDSKYELAKAKKEIAEKTVEIETLKANTAAEINANKELPILDKGSRDKEVKDEITLKADKVKKFAFGENE